MLKNLFATTGVSALLLGTLLSCGGGGGGDNDPPPPPPSQPNEKPIANAGFDQTASNGDRVILDGSRSSDPDGDIITFDWQLQQKPDGSQADLNNPTSPNPDFLIDQPGTYTVKLTVSDSNESSNPDQVQISTINSPPIANAGSDQTARLNQTITLDGTASGDFDGDALRYQWELTRKPASSQAMLSDETVSRPTLDIDQVGEYIATLQVNDGQIDSETDIVTIKLDNTPPTANAGPDQSAQAGNNVVLDGTHSTDVDGDALTYKWSLSAVPENSQANIATPDNVKPIFNVDQTGTYIAQLIVSDGQINSNPDTIRISTENSRPIARAGDDQAITMGESVVLNGSNSSDPDNDTLIYNWSIQSRPNNSTATLSNPMTAQPGFTADIAGTYVIQLIVNDGVLHSEPDTIVASTVNTRPIAIPEAMQTVSVNNMVALNAGNSTDADSDILSYKWAILIKPKTSTATITDTAIVNPGIEPDQPGVYVIQLIVNDGELYSKPATITIEAKSVTPIADAGPDQQVSLNDVVTLDGSNSTGAPNGTLTYQWTILQKPNGSNVALTDRTIVNPQFTMIDNGSYLIELIVSENDITSAPDTVLITTATTTTLAPAITSFSPASGPVSTLVTILGENFKPIENTLPVVKLNAKTGGTINAPVTSFDNTSIRFTVPAGSVTGPITVEVLGQTATSTENLTLVASKNFTLTAANTSTKVIRGYSTAFSLSLSTTTRFNQLANLTITGLPAGMQASFKPESITGGQQTVLTITAAQDQFIGISSITVTAQAEVEGITVSDSVNLQFTVEAVSTSFMGRTVMDNNLQTPLGGITVTFIGKDAEGNDTGCTASTVSDDAGNFVFTNLPTECQGIQLIRYDGLTASNEGDYAGVDLQYNVIANQVTQSPVLVHLPRIDNAETVQVIQNHTEDQEFVFNTIPYLEVTVYAGTTLTLPDGTQPDPFPLIAIDIPVDRLPEEMPPDSANFSPFIVAFQPANSKASQPVAVTFPNSTNVAPNTAVGLSTLDPTKGVMVPYGTGIVSPDGSQVIPDFDPANPNRRFGLVNFDWHGPFFPRPPNISPSGDLCFPTAGDPIDLSTGLQVYNETDMVVSGARGSIAIQRTYREQTTEGGAFGIGTGHNYSYRLDTNNPRSANAINLIMPTGARRPLTRPNIPSNPGSGNRIVSYVSFALPKLLGVELVPYNNGESDLIWKDGTTFRFVPSTRLLGSVLQSITEANGNKVTIVRNPSNPLQIVEIIDPVGRKLKLDYDSTSRVTTITDPLGRQVTYTYSAAGKLATVTYPDTNATKYEYDAQNRLSTITNERGIVIAQNTYDDNNKVIQQIQADGGILKFEYELMNPQVGTSPVMRTTLTDPKGNQTIYRFNPQGFTTDVTDAQGQTRIIERQPGTNVIKSLRGTASCSVCGASSTGERSYSYDLRGNRTSVTDAVGQTTFFAYQDRFNKIIKVTDPLGNITNFGYDDKGNLTSVTDAKNNSSNLQYNAFGLPIKAVDPAGITSTINYDEFANPVEIIDHLNHKTTTRYDAISRPIEFIDAMGRRSSVQYDSMGRTKSSTDAKGNTTTFGYDEVGNLTALTDARNNTTRFTYDSMNRLIDRIDSLGNTDSREYDANGNLIKFTDRRSQITTFMYDVLDRLENVTFNDGKTIQYRYDAKGRVNEVDDDNSGQYTFNYDDVGRLIQEVHANGAISYEYDEMGRLTKRQVIGQDFVDYQYDQVHNLTNITSPSVSFAFNYDNRYLLDTMVRSNGVTTDYAYDDLGQVTSISHLQNTNLLSQQTYNYDSNGNRILMANDIAQALTTPASVNNIDANSNRLLDHGNSTYDYDLNGNRSSEIGSAQYSWNARDQLESIDFSNGDSIQLQYDFLGNLIRKTNTTSNVTATESYLVDRFSNVVSQTYANSDQISVITAPGIDSHLATVGSNGQIQFGLTDALNSTVATTNQLGNIQDTFFYEPFGATQISGGDYPFLYTGRTQINNSLYYYRARFYEPKVGIFVSEDPIGFSGNDLNLYRYVNNNAINGTDPSGNFGLVGAAIGGTLSLITGIVENKSSSEIFINVGVGAAVGFVGGRINPFAIGFLSSFATQYLNKRCVNGTELFIDTLTGGISAKLIARQFPNIPGERFGGMTVSYLRGVRNVTYDSTYIDFAKEGISSLYAGTIKTSLTLGSIYTGFDRGCACN